MGSTSVLGASSGSHEGDNRQIGSDVPLLYRWQFNLKTGTVQEHLLDDDHPCEFPRINE